MGWFLLLAALLFLKVVPRGAEAHPETFYSSTGILMVSRPQAVSAGGDTPASRSYINILSWVTDPELMDTFLDDHHVFERGWKRLPATMSVRLAEFKAAVRLLPVNPNLRLSRLLTEQEEANQPVGAEIEIGLNAQAHRKIAMLRPTLLLRVYGTAREAVYTQVYVRCFLSALQEAIGEAASAPLTESVTATRRLLVTNNRRIRRLEGQLKRLQRRDAMDPFELRRRSGLLDEERQRLQSDLDELQRKLFATEARPAVADDAPEDVRARFDAVRDQYALAARTYKPDSPVLLSLGRQLAATRTVLERTQRERQQSELLLLQSKQAAIQSRFRALESEVRGIEADLPGQTVQVKIHSLTAQLDGLQREQLALQKALLNARLQAQAAAGQGSAYLLQPATPGLPVVQIDYLAGARLRWLSVLPLAAFGALFAVLASEAALRQWEPTHRMERFCQLPVVAALPRCPSPPVPSTGPGRPERNLT